MRKPVVQAKRMGTKKGGSTRFRVHLVLKIEYSINVVVMRFLIFWNFNCCRQNRKNEIEK